MEKRIFGGTAAFVLGLAVAASGADQQQINELIKKQGGPKPDERIELKLPAQMKSMQKAMMRKQLDTLAEITGALAANDLRRAAAIAKENMGWSAEEEKRCSMVEQITGQTDFTKLGKAVHMKAEELATAALAGERDRALNLLGELIRNCNACHYTFRH